LPTNTKRRKKRSNTKEEKENNKNTQHQRAKLINNFFIRTRRSGVEAKTRTIFPTPFFLHLFPKTAQRQLGPPYFEILEQMCFSRREGNEVKTSDICSIKIGVLVRQFV